MSTETFNHSVRDGSAGKKLARILEEARPEAVYFTELDGKRTAILIVDVPNPSAIPSLAEPWFLLFNAEVEIRSVMTPEDLKASGIDGIGAKWAS